MRKEERERKRNEGRKRAIKDKIEASKLHYSDLLPHTGPVPLDPISYEGQVLIQESVLFSKGGF